MATNGIGSLGGRRAVVRCAPVHTSLAARIAFGTATLAATGFAGMPLCVRLGWLPSELGFRLFMLGALLGVLTLLLGLVALFTTRASTGRSGRGQALIATGVGAAIVALVGVAAGPSLSLPVINDISTDLEDPPTFSALLEAPANVGRDMKHPGAETAAAQRLGYPDLGPVDLALEPRQALLKTQTAMEALGWKIERSDIQRGEIEATETSRTFRFVDDISVRIRPIPTGSRVDIRSKSRDGKGDLGANAARIQKLSRALQ